MPIFLSLLLLLIPNASPLNFNFNPITRMDEPHFNLSGDAFIDQSIHLTTEDVSEALSSRLGRATYKEPLFLWDNSTRNLCNFSTNFTFVINSNGNDNFTDGLAFFLAPLDSILKTRPIEGASIGLGNPWLSSLPSKTFVAVEFDTFLDSFDPFYKGTQGSLTTVGININNMTSVNSSSGYFANKTEEGILTFEVDLRDFLPQYVMVGFSAATGEFFEQNIIKSWKFSSTLTEESPPTAIVKGNNKGLIYGLCVGIPVIVVAAALAIFLVWRKKNVSQGFVEEGHFSDSTMNNEFGQGVGPRRFSYSELAAATDTFADDRKLGQGGFGCVYKGLLTSTNTVITVKRVSQGSRQGKREYMAEVKIIGECNILCFPDGIPVTPS